MVHHCSAESPNGVFSRMAECLDGYMLARVGKDRRGHAFKEFTTQEPRISNVFEYRVCFLLISLDDPYSFEVFVDC